MHFTRNYYFNWYDWFSWLIFQVLAYGDKQCTWMYTLVIPATVTDDTHSQAPSDMNVFGSKVAQQCPPVEPLCCAGTTHWICFLHWPETCQVRWWITDNSLQIWTVPTQWGFDTYLKGHKQKQCGQLRYRRKRVPHRLIRNLILSHHMPHCIFASM